MTKRLKRMLGLAVFAIVLPALASGPAQAGAQKSLYERVGGVQAIAAVVDDFVNRLLEDPVILANPKTVEAMKRVTVPGLKFQLTALVCQVAGGPEKYTGRPMKDVHQGMGITEREWEAMARDFKLTLVKFKVPEREQHELFAAVGMTRKEIVEKL